MRTINKILLLFVYWHRSVASFTTLMPLVNNTILPYITSRTNPNESTSTEKPALVCKQKHRIENKVLRTNVSCNSPEKALKCFHDPIFCSKYFTSGQRELEKKRPAYGEYSYLDHKQWFYIIQHGGLAFLFHPCTSEKEINKLRQMASDCLHRYILAPYAMLSESKPVAIVSWGCFYLSSVVNITRMKSWICNHAYNGPASHVDKNGKYVENLVKKSLVITDVKDTFLCPNKEQKMLFTTTVVPQTKKATHNPEAIIDKRYKVLKKQKHVISISTNKTLTKVETGSAVWAAGSLVFLCGILLGLLLYTKMWAPREWEPFDRRFSGDFKYELGHSQFSLLKSSQKFMSMFRKDNKQERKSDSLSRVNLMVPIDEEDEEDDVLFHR